MTPAETPTECEHDCDCDMYHYAYECLIDQKDARIRELEGFIDLFFAHVPTDGSCDECAAIKKARAALARSEGKP